MSAIADAFKAFALIAVALGAWIIAPILGAVLSIAVAMWLVFNMLRENRKG